MFLSSLVLSALVASTAASGASMAPSSASAAASSVASTAPSSEYTFPAGFDINAVPMGERSAWCTAQRNTCPDICGGVANSNTCDPTSLSFSCVCSNGTAADVTPYINTVPYFVCQAEFGQCIQAHVSDATAQDKCKQQKKENCGNLNATQLAQGSSSAAHSGAPATNSAPSPTAAQTPNTGSASPSSASASPTNAAVLMAQEYSTSLLAAALFLALRLAL